MTPFTNGFSKAQTPWQQTWNQDQANVGLDCFGYPRKDSQLRPPHTILPSSLRAAKRRGNPEQHHQ